MRYLADAYNRDNVAALHYVTTPSAFNALIAMRSEAVDLQLKSCAPTARRVVITGLEQAPVQCRAPARSSSCAVAPVR